MRKALEENLRTAYDVQGIENPDQEAIDYPDVAARVARLVSEKSVERGILICGSGIGMCVVANKFRGVRAAPCYNMVAVELSRKHNNANVLCLSSDMLGLDVCVMMVNKWLTTEFEGGRHGVRIDKIMRIESETMTG